MTAVLLAPDAPWPLSPTGSGARRVAGVWWLIFGLAVVVALVVLAAVVLALFRGRHRGAIDDAEPTHRRFIIVGGLVFPIVVLSIVAFATVDATATLRRPAPDAERLDIVGEQWFWRVNYPAEGVVTANEVRLPVDRPAELHMHSNDVVHSFWVPQLAGKLDLTPGESPVLRFTPEEVGTYRGECAEFCGLQHANMNFVVVVMSQPDFDRWI